MDDVMKKELIDGLNTDLAHEYSAIMSYRSYASMVRGPYRQELRAFFEAEITDELNHAQLLADRIVALGGTPTTRVAPVQLTTDAKEMLKHALEAEVDTIGRYVKRRKQAEELEMHGLAIDLDTLIADESNHRDEIRLMLDQWE